MVCIREPAVAGLFYPSGHEQLTQTVDNLLRQKVSTDASPPKALIVPHAGYIYSGETAAIAFASLRPAASTIRRVVILGPSHYIPFRGLAVSGADLFMTPLGPLEVDTQAVERIADLPQVVLYDDAHEREHSLEVELPFLQRVLDEFQVVPIAVGDARADEVAEVLEAIWGGPETLIVVSSDLSHYHDYDTARRLDRATSENILALGPAPVDDHLACGSRPINGLLEVARRKGLKAELLDLRNSGDGPGDRSRVVGYGAYGFH